MVTVLSGRERRRASPRHRAMRRPRSSRGHRSRRTSAPSGPVRPTTSRRRCAFCRRACSAKRPARFGRIARRPETPPSAARLGGDVSFEVVVERDSPIRFLPRMQDAAVRQGGDERRVPARGGMHGSQRDGANDGSDDDRQTPAERRTPTVDLRDRVVAVRVRFGDDFGRHARLSVRRVHYRRERGILARRYCW